jgi:hypothetical protein
VLGAAVDARVYDLLTEPCRYAQRLEELVQEHIQASNKEALTLRSPSAEQRARIPQTPAKGRM